MLIFPRPFTVLSNGCIACYKMQPRGYNPSIPLTLNLNTFWLMYEGESWIGSRLSYHLNKGPIPRHPPHKGNQYVLHTCDNEWCIDSDHLYLGTIKQNTIDKFERHPTIKQILSENANWARRSDESKAASLATLNSRYVRTPESKQRSAESRRRHWAALTPEQYAERCRRISEGKRRK